MQVSLHLVGRHVNLCFSGPRFLPESSHSAWRRILPVLSREVDITCRSGHATIETSKRSFPRVSCLNLFMDQYLVSDRALLSNFVRIMNMSKTIIQVCSPTETPVSVPRQLCLWRSVKDELSYVLKTEITTFERGKLLHDTTLMTTRNCQLHPSLSCARCHVPTAWKSKDWPTRMECLSWNSSLLHCCLAYFENMDDILYWVLTARTHCVDDMVLSTVSASEHTLCDNISGGVVDARATLKADRRLEFLASIVWKRRDG